MFNTSMPRHPFDFVHPSARRDSPQALDDAESFTSTQAFLSTKPFVSAGFVEVSFSVPVPQQQNVSEVQAAEATQSLRDRPHIHPSRLAYMDAPEPVEYYPPEDVQVGTTYNGKKTGSNDIPLGVRGSARSVAQADPPAPPASTSVSASLGDLVVVDTPSDRAFSGRLSGIVSRIATDADTSRHPHTRERCDSRRDSPEFDFGSGMPLPPPSRQPPLISRRLHSTFRSLSTSHDPTLLEYLHHRHISPGFLVEIDLFLANHPELWEHSLTFCQTFNGATPLAAYRFFLKGYTKPARYVKGVLPETDIDLAALLPRGALSSIAVAPFDEELIDFFDGYEFRFDILQKVDLEVAWLVDFVFAGGRRLTRAQRLLVGYTLFGNAIDAYKFYEYNYQTEWLPHKYLPEHVVLGEIPRPADYSEPIPRLIGSTDEPYPENRRSFPFTRLRMARAMDAGVDVIDVLLEDLTSEMARKGFRRNEIEDARRKATKAIDYEREVGGGRDIVDLAMNMMWDVYTPQPRERAPGTSTFREDRYSGAPGVDLTSTILKVGSTSIRTSNTSSVNIVRHVQTDPKLKGHRDRLTRSRNELVRAYKAEAAAKAALSNFRRGPVATKVEEKELASLEARFTQAVNDRRRCERSMANELVGYGRATGEMDSLTAQELQHEYSQKRQLQIEEAGWKSRWDLLAMCPRGV